MNELARTLEEVAGVRAGRVAGDARAGELRHSVLSVARMARRGWEPAMGLRDGLADTFSHIAASRAVASVG